MAGNRDINDAHPRLKKAWAHVIAEWPKRYPSDPVPFLGEVYRSPDVQRAYYAQGRRPVGEVNRLRQSVGLGQITEEENRKTITSAAAGQSKHQKKPSEAIDVYFARGKILDYDDRLYAQLHNLIKEVEPGIEWGKYFRRVDTPHFQI